MSAEHRLTLVESTQLERYGIDDVTFDDALEAVAATGGPLATGGVGFGWSADSVELCVVTGGVAVDRDGEPVRTDRWFEGRVFNRSAELRWAARGATGRAVLIGEDPGHPPQGWTSIETNTLARIDGASTLVWGRAAAVNDAGVRSDWTSLVAARVGSVEVPIGDVPQMGSVVLRSCEYLGRAEDGNAVVVEERLLGFQAQTAPDDAPIGDPT